ncbi:MAG: sodium:calcium antiporter [Candidatus Paceibacterota bacterium]|jgi:cation:H+ antiporter
MSSTTLVNIFLFVSSIGIVWYFAGVLIESVTHLARRFKKTGFTAAFFLLGFLTSISEFSVATNATLKGVPEVSVGNLIGGSFVVLLFIVPLLAVLAGKIELRNTLSRRNLLLALTTVALPALLVIDGNVTRVDGLVSILVYITLVYSIYRQKQDIPDTAAVKRPFDIKRPLITDIGRILLGGVMIFFASKVLVDQAVFFALLFGAPTSLVGLLLLSLGTNIPEFTVAIRSVIKNHSDVAFGDYIGSSAVNTFIFGMLPFASGAFLFNTGETTSTTILLVIGLVVFFLFARSDSKLTRREGGVLLVFYLAFIALQIGELVKYATQ